MSSNHTRISNREWEAMRQNVSETNAYVIRRQEEARRIAQAAEQRRREIIVEQERNRQAVNQAINAMSNAYRNTLRTAGNRFASEVQTRGAEFDRQISSLQQDLRQASGQLDRADSRVDALARQYNEAFQALLAQTAQGKERAERIKEELDRFMEQIRALDPERFMPGEYASLAALQASVNANIAAGDFSAATIVSQNSILTASRMLTRLTIMNQAFEERLTQLRNVSVRVEQRLNELESEDGVLSVDGQDYEYDIAYWSGGEFARIRQEYSRIYEQLESGRMNERDLEVVSQSLARLEQQIEQCDQRARQEMVGSIFVEDTAVRLHNNLAGRGWNLEQAGHHADEAKNPYTLVYEDGNGSTVSIVVSSGQQADKPTYAIEVFSDDQVRASIIKEGVHASMASEGLQIEGIERRDDCHLNPTPQAFIRNTVNEAMSRKR